MIPVRNAYFKTIQQTHSTNSEPQHCSLHTSSISSLKKLTVLASKLSHQEQHTATTICTTSRGRIFAYLKKYVKDNELPVEEFSILTSYRSVLLDKKNAVGTALSVFRMCSKDANLLGKLLSLSNFNDQECLTTLVSIWVDASVPPAQIVYMLVQITAKADHSTTLFSDGSPKSFWLHNLEMYNKIKQDTRAANTDHEQLLRMLFAVVEQQSPETDNSVAYTTILKMLGSPSTAHLSSSHENMMKLMSILLLDRTLPFNVLSMLTHAEADADKFNILSKDVEDFTHTANVDVQQLLIKLHAVGMQGSSLTDQYLVRSTVLKILISPEIVAVITNQLYLERMI